MSSFEIQLPDHLAQYVADRAKSGGFSDSGDFIVSLVSALSERQSTVEGLLIEGIESGPVSDWDSNELQEIKDRLGKTSD